MGPFTFELGVQEITGAVATVDASIAALGLALSAELQEIVVGLATVDASVLSLIPALLEGFASVVGSVTASQEATVAALSTLTIAVSALPAIITAQTNALVTAMTNQTDRIVSGLNAVDYGIPFPAGSELRFLQRLSSSTGSFTENRFTKTGTGMNIFTLFWPFSFTGIVATFYGAGTDTGSPNRRPHPELLVPTTLPYYCVMEANNQLYDVVIISITS